MSTEKRFRFDSFATEFGVKEEKPTAAAANATTTAATDNDSGIGESSIVFLTRHYVRLIKKSKIPLTNRILAEWSAAVLVVAIDFRYVFSPFPSLPLRLNSHNKPASV